MQVSSFFISKVSSIHYAKKDLPDEKTFFLRKIWLSKMQCFKDGLGFFKHLSSLVFLNMFSLMLIDCYYDRTLSWIAIVNLLKKF